MNKAILFLSMMILPSLATAHEPVTISCVNIYKEAWDTIISFSLRVTPDINETRAAGSRFLGLGAIHEEKVAWTAAHLFVLHEAAVIQISRFNGIIEIWPPNTVDVSGDSGTRGGCTNRPGRWEIL